MTKKKEEIRSHHGHLWIRYCLSFWDMMCYNVGVVVVFNCLILTLSRRKHLDSLEGIDESEKIAIAFMLATWLPQVRGKFLSLTDITSSVSLQQ